MLKHLVLQYFYQQPTGDYFATATVEHQTFRGRKFNKTSNKFIATSDVELISCERPDILVFDNWTLRPPRTTIIVYLRGRDTNADNNRLLIPNLVVMDKIQLAVHEYNKARGP